RLLPRHLRRREDTCAGCPQPARSGQPAPAGAGAPRDHRPPAGHAQGAAGRVGRRSDRRLPVGREEVTLPETLDANTVRAVAMDLDRTILPETLELRPRLIDAVRAVAAAGVVPIVATGRMLRSSLPFALQMGGTAPLICYQAAL